MDSPQSSDTAFSMISGGLFCFQSRLQLAVALCSVTLISFVATICATYFSKLTTFTFVSIVSTPAGTNMSNLWQGNSRDSKIRSSCLVSDWSRQYRGSRKIIDWIWTRVIDRTNKSQNVGSSHSSQNYILQLIPVSIILLSLKPWKHCGFVFMLSKTPTTGRHPTFPDFQSHDTYFM